MNANPVNAEFEIVTLPIGEGRRLRIAGGRLTFMRGFDGDDRVAERLRTTPSNWLDKLKSLTDRL